MMNKAIDTAIKDLSKAQAEGATHVTIEIDTLVILLSTAKNCSERLDKVEANYREMTGDNDYAKGM